MDQQEFLKKCRNGNLKRVQQHIYYTREQVTEYHKIRLRNDRNYKEYLKWCLLVNEIPMDKFEFLKEIGKKDKDESGFWMWSLLYTGIWERSPNKANFRKRVTKSGYHGCHWYRIRERVRTTGRIVSVSTLDTLEIRLFFCHGGEGGSNDWPGIAGIQP